jgi:VTC domain
LSPVCSITYLRTALVGRHADGTVVRLTLDQELFSERVDALTLGEPARGIRIGGEQQILELKFLGAMPAVFKELLETYPLNRVPMSKYRTAAAALGLAAQNA